MYTTRKSYLNNGTDAEWEFLLPYLSLMREDAPQRQYPLRDLLNAIRYVVGAVDGYPPFCGIDTRKRIGIGSHTQKSSDALEGSLSGDGRISQPTPTWPPR
jgi:hypothetical protein